MSNEAKDLGRITEAVEQIYKSQDRMWNEFATVRQDLSKTSLELREVLQAIKITSKEVETLRTVTASSTNSIESIRTELVVNKRWIRWLSAAIAAAIPIMATQIVAKTDLISAIERRLYVVEWQINKEDFYGKQERFPSPYIPIPKGND